MGSATVFSLDEVIVLHRGFRERGEYRRIGRLVKIVLAELPKDVTLAIPEEERLQEGRTLDWFDKGPMLGLGPADVDLLVTSVPIPELPKKPKPGWKPEELSQKQIEEQVRTTGKYTPQTAPLVEQKPEDRGCTRVRGTSLLSFEPVYEILFHPFGIQRWGRISFLPVGITKTAFVWDYRTGEGFFYGGRFTVEL